LTGKVIVRFDHDLKAPEHVPSLSRAENCPFDIVPLIDIDPDPYWPAEPTYFTPSLLAQPASAKAIMNTNPRTEASHLRGQAN
jgi:hypothetical protein